MRTSVSEQSIKTLVTSPTYTNPCIGLDFARNTIPGSNIEHEYSKNESFSTQRRERTLYGEHQSDKMTIFCHRY